MKATFKKGLLYQLPTTGFLLIESDVVEKINGFRIDLDHIEEILRKKKINVNCYLFDEKINVYTNVLKNKRRIIKSYFYNNLNLTSNQFLIKKKNKIKQRKKIKI